MFQFVEFLRKRPSDATIRTVRFVFAAILAALLAGANAQYSLPWNASLGEPNATYAEFLLAGIVMVPGIVAAFGCCVAKRKYVRIGQIAGSVFLFVFATLIVPAEPSAMAPTKELDASAINASDIIKTAEPVREPLNVSKWLTVLAFFPLLSGMSGKMTTEKCQKYGEKITKIRV